MYGQAEGVQVSNGIYFAGRVIAILYNLFFLFLYLEKMAIENIAEWKIESG